MESSDVKTAQTLRPSFWRREHHLDKMTFRELVIAYAQYPAIIAYVLLSAIAIGLSNGSNTRMKLVIVG